MKKILFLAVFLLLSTPFSNVEAAKIDQKVLNEMLTTVNEDYLYPVNNAELVANGLNALHNLDKKFVAYKGSDRVYMYYDQTITAIIPFPADDKDIGAWVKGLNSALQAASKVSEDVALHDFELPDLIMKGMLSGLDKYSHYYSQYEYKEEDYRHNFRIFFASRMIEDILYLNIRLFNKQTSAKVREALGKNPQAAGVIIDLRGNAGGMLNEAIKTADLFTDDEIITYTTARDNSNVHYYISKKGVLCDKPMVILIDGETASAAEVLAAGLQDQSRAKLVGTKSFGKGTVQNITEISNGGKLVLTTEQFFTPSGKVIHENGAEPDICTELWRDDKCSREPRSGKEEDIETAVKLLHGELDDEL